MASLIPISTYNLALKPFNPIPAIEDDYPVTIRITLAAVDPEAVDDKAEPSTLRLLKKTNPFIDDDEDDFDDEDDEDEDDEDDLDELDDEELAKKVEELKDEEAEEAEEDEEEEEEDDEDEEDDEEEDGVSEFIVCTLSPKVQFQQTIDITINPDEEVYFVVTGSYPIHLSGNYVEHPADEDDEDEDDYYEDDDEDDEYNLTPDEDELIDGEEYDLEDLENEEDVVAKIEELIGKDLKNGKKRSIEEVEEDEEEEDDDEEESEPKKSKKEKSVQFTKELEQGPTGSSLTEKKETKKERKQRQKAEKAAAAAAEKKESAAPVEAESKKAESKKDESKKYPTKTLLGGVVTEDRKVGKGTTAKGGNKVGIRYIGKLKNGKVFDKNTNGKPFSFNLGKGECIKGFDLGVAGMAIGGERRVVIPAKMGYGSQALPGIPANSELTFDIKLVSLK
ncbi:hypothetical protein DFJ63DRAFT_311087 [Scheffersomyces coipomensis]|uniref:uncharacterized protein n=1 Tax=Scheffersomyces coipomensis TaxID=1788519 RepID=UPI00315D9079